MSNRTIIDVPLDKITAHPNQPKTRNDVKKLAQSIKSMGLIEPIVAIAYEDKSVDEKGVQYMIVSGHRRYAAVKTLGWKEVPVFVTKLTDKDMPTDAAFRNTVKQLVSSNTNREDFTAVEEADALQGMLELGMTIEDVTKVTGIDKEEVTKAEFASQNVKPTIKQKLASDHELTLNHLAGIARHPEEAQELLESGNQFWHVLSRLDKNKEAEKNVAIEVARLEEIAVPLVDRPKYDDKKTIQLDVLGIMPVNHRACKGHAAYVATDYEGKAHIAYVCTDAPANHNFKPNARSEHDQDILDKGREGMAFKKDGAAPTIERRRWITEQIKGKKQWKGLNQFLALMIAKGKHDTSDLAFEFSGVKRKTGDHRYEITIPKTEDKAMDFLLGQVFSKIDENCRLSQGLDHHQTPGVPEYLAFLKKNNYTLSLHEEQFLVD